MVSLRCEISTLKENDHDAALLSMVENRMAQESSYICYGFGVIVAKSKLSELLIMMMMMIPTLGVR